VRIKLQYSQCFVLPSTLALRTPRYYGQELKTWEIRITEKHSRCYGRQNLLPMVSVMKTVDCTKKLGGNHYRDGGLDT